MGALDIDHPDTPEFITYKATINKQIEFLKLQNPEYGELLESLKELTFFNLSMSARDDFMEQVKDYMRHGIDSDWNFISRADGKVHSTVKVGDLWETLTYNAWKSGDPGLLFMDAVNKDNPIPSQPMYGTNPCGEQPLGEYESCVLGSINILHHISYEGGVAHIDFLKLSKTVESAVSFLDLVIDRNLYPLPQIEEMTKANRKIGLGVMGIADALYALKMRYGREQSLRLSNYLMNFITTCAEVCSSKLAVEKGNFPNWEISVYSDKGTPMRNATRTTIAPTGTISILAGVSGGIEPNFLLAYDRIVKETHSDGQYTLRFINPVLEKTLKERGLYSTELIDKIIARGGTVQGMKEIPEDMQEIFVTSFDVTTEEHLLMQKAFQDHTDNAVSKTINLPSTATPEDVGLAYLRAWELGLKGITIYRDGSIDNQILSSTKQEEKVEEIIEQGHTSLEEQHSGTCPQCNSTAYNNAEGCAYCFACGYSPCK